MKSVSQRKTKIVWFLGTMIFLVFRFLTDNLQPESFVVGLLFCVLSLWWFLVPVVAGKDISVPSFPNIKLKKGEADYARYLFFSLGVFGYVVALFA